MSSSSDVRIGMIELSALLQCLGFSIRPLNTKEGNISQEEGSSTVVISCQESGATLLKSLLKSQRERLLKDLQDIVRCIKQQNESDVEEKQEPLSNKSDSMLDLKTPQQRLELNYVTPTRSRSLDTLFTKDHHLPTPRDPAKQKKFVCKRQRSFSFSTTPETSIPLKNTSSPIQVALQSILNELIATEKVVEGLKNKMSNVIRDFVEKGEPDFSTSAINSWKVSKISGLKSSKISIIKYASSPNLFGLGEQDNYLNMLKHLEKSASTGDFTPISTLKDGASTSNFTPISTPKDRNISKLKPTVLFKNSPKILIKKYNSQDIKGGKLNNLLKPKISPPVRKPTINLDGNPKLCVSRKKISHVKSLIPRVVLKKQ